MIKIREALLQIFDQRVKTKSRLIGDLWLRVRMCGPTKAMKIQSLFPQRMYLCWMIPFFWKVSLPSVASFSHFCHFFLRRLRMREKTGDRGNSSRQKKKKSNSTKKVVYLKKNWIFVSGCFLSLKATKSFEWTRLPGKHLSSLRKVGT